MIVGQAHNLSGNNRITVFCNFLKRGNITIETHQGSKGMNSQAEG